MKIIWLCNMMPGAVREAMGGSSGGGLWVDHVLSDLRALPEHRLRILCLAQAETAGSLDERTDYQLFREEEPYRYLESLETLFRRQLSSFRPDVIHIWGTEFSHTLAMVNAARRLGVEKRIIVSIQGLCSVYAGHFLEGVPEHVRRGVSFRDFVRWDNLVHQQQKYVLRGRLERQALEQVHHVIGRTDWDRACTSQINPNAQYHFCNETMREVFYEDRWRYASCRKHSVFASSREYPIKGFHYLLEAMSIVCRRYPDAQISVPGLSYFPGSISQYLREQNYDRYLRKLTRKYGLEGKVHFLGYLNAKQMKAAFLDANVFVLPSSIENSPNSLGEAMLLGVPSVAADVGGVSNLMHPGEGFMYQSTAPYMLAHYILEVFAMEDRAEQMGEAARAHARCTHNPEANRKALLSAYQEAAAE